MAEDDRATNDALVTYLRAVDARCPNCRYELRGSSSSTCPECGTALRLTLVTRNRLMGWSGWWLAGVFGLAFSSLALCAVAWRLLEPVAALLHFPQARLYVAQGFGATNTLPNWSSIFSVAALAMIMLALLAAMLSSRRGFTAMRWPVQAALGIAAAVSPLAALGALAIVIRAA